MSSLPSAPLFSAAVSVRVEDDRVAAGAVAHVGGPADPAQPLFHHTSIAGSFDMAHAVLGSGRFGDVFSAVCRYTGEHFAVKVVADSAMARNEVEQHLRCAALSPSFVQIHRIFVEDRWSHRLRATVPHLFIVMDYMDCDLFTFVKENGPLPEPVCARMARQLVEALVVLEQCGLVHRDIKPENILVSRRQMSVKLSDFGFCVPDGTVDGTRYSPAYASPEVVQSIRAGRRGERPWAASHVVDVWAMGATFYVMLTASMPFVSGLDTPEQEARILAGRLRWDERLAVSGPAKDFVRGLLRVDPAVRLTATAAAQHAWLAQ